MELEDLTKTPLPTLRPRDANSHKGDFGRALLIGGSRGMSGAISLSGQAALRSGAGLVTLAMPTSVLDVVASIEPSYMTTALSDDIDHIAQAATQTAFGLSQDATAVALGPGLGRASSLVEFVTDLYRDVSKPLVVDADALFALAERKEALVKPGGPRILTPHPGEFARLAGTVPEGRRRIAAAAELARRNADGKTTRSSLMVHGLAPILPAILAWRRAAPATCLLASSPPCSARASCRLMPRGSACTSTDSPVTLPRKSLDKSR